MRIATLGLIISAAAGLLFLSTGSAQAQSPGIEKVSFSTVDKVRLKGTIYRGKNIVPRRSPCVMFVHGWGKDRTKGGWDELAKGLQEKGYTVLSFDLRGHGESWDLEDKRVFWDTSSFPSNSMAMRGRPSSNNLPPRIDYKDFHPQYFFWMINDIAAARRFLDAENDAGLCNSGKIFLVAETEGAALSMLWLGSEYLRDAIAATIPGVPPPRHKGGEDVCGCVWLSIDHNPLGLYGQMPYANNRLWASTQSQAGDIIEPIREKMAMTFFLGKKDESSYRSTVYWYQQKFYGHTVTDKKDKRMYPVLLDTNLKGADLLGKESLKTDATIIEFIDEINKRGAGNNWVTRNVDKIDLYPVPLDRIGVR